MQAIKRISRDIIKDLLIITVGALIASFGVAVFLKPYGLIPGGISGISIIITELTGLPISLTLIPANILIFILGFKYLGNSTGIRSIIGMITYSFGLDFFIRTFPHKLTEDVILAILYAGVIQGFAYAMIYSSGGSTGGTDILALITNRYFDIPIGKFQLTFNTVLAIVNGLIFKSADKVLLTIFAFFVSSYSLDVALSGIHSTKTILIISDHVEEISSFIIQELRRGVTFIPIIGGYTGKNRTMIMTTVRRAQMPRVKKKIHTLDPEAFMMIFEPSEVWGHGFKIPETKK